MHVDLSSCKWQCSFYLFCDLSLASFVNQVFRYVYPYRLVNICNPRIYAILKVSKEIITPHALVSLIKYKISKSLKVFRKALTSKVKSKFNIYLMVLGDSSTMHHHISHLSILIYGIFTILSCLKYAWRVFFPLSTPKLIFQVLSNFIGNDYLHISIFKSFQHLYLFSIVDIIFNAPCTRTMYVSYP